MEQRKHTKLFTEDVDDEDEDWVDIRDASLGVPQVGGISSRRARCFLALMADFTFANFRKTEKTSRAVLLPRADACSRLL